MALTENTYPASDTHDDYSSTDKVSTFGGELDLWGNEWSAEKLNDPTFKLLFDADVGAGILRVDEIAVEVFFTLPYSYDPEGRPFAPSALNACAIGRGPSGAPRIVLVGANGTIKTSDDGGQSWTERDSGVADNLWGVSAGFIAVGENGVILTSEDGTEWSQEDSASTDHFYAVTQGKKGAVALGRNSEIRRKPGTEWLRARR